MSVLVIDLVPHMDAGDRTKWQGDQYERPLTELGRQQAIAFADELSGESVDALYSSPARRCRQTLEPLAERNGLEIEVLSQLAEETWTVPDGWSPDRNGGINVGAFASGSALAAVERVRRAHPEGRVVACSHGHIIPALASMLIAAHDLRGVGELTHRGQWFRLRFEGDALALELREAAGFPS